MSTTPSDRPPHPSGEQPQGYTQAPYQTHSQPSPEGRHPQDRPQDHPQAPGPVDPPRASRGRSIGAGLCLMLGSLLLIFSGAHAISSAPDRLTTALVSPSYAAGQLIADVMIVAAGVILIFVSSRLRRSRVTRVLFVTVAVLAALRLISLVIAISAVGVAPQAASYALVVSVTATAVLDLVALVVLVYGIVMLFRRGHVLESPAARTAADGQARR